MNKNGQPINDWDEHYQNMKRDKWLNSKHSNKELAQRILELYDHIKKVEVSLAQYIHNQAHLNKERSVPNLVDRINGVEKEVKRVMLGLATRMDELLPLSLWQKFKRLFKR